MYIEASVIQLQCQGVTSSSHFKMEDINDEVSQKLHTDIVPYNHR